MVGIGTDSVTTSGALVVQAARAAVSGAGFARLFPRSGCLGEPKKSFRIFFFKIQSLFIAFVSRGFKSSSNCKC